MEDGLQRRQPTGGAETSLGGSRSNPGEDRQTNKQNPKNYSYVRKVSVWAPGWTVQLWGLLVSSLLQASLSDWTLANYHWFCRCFFLKIFGIPLFLEVLLLLDTFFLILVTLAWNVHYVVSSLGKLHTVWAGPVKILWFSDGRCHLRMAWQRWD